MSNETMQDIQAGKNRFRTFMSVIFCVLVIAGLCDIRYELRTAAVQNQQRVEGLLEDVKATRAELMGFMMRTVERWDKFAGDHPELTVPKVVEPLPPGKTLTNKEMTR